MQSNENLTHYFIVVKESAVQQMITVKNNNNCNTNFEKYILVYHSNQFLSQFQVKPNSYFGGMSWRALSCCVYTLYMMLVFLNKNHKMHMKSFSEQLWRWSLFSKMTDTENTASVTSAWVCFVDETVHLRHLDMSPYGKMFMWSDLLSIYLYKTIVTFRIIQ